jgi:hypothetical protein
MRIFKQEEAVCPPALQGSALKGVGWPWNMGLQEHRLLGVKVLSFVYGGIPQGLGLGKDWG